VSQPTREPSRQNERETPERVRDRRLVVGTILVLFGVVMLIETLTTWSLLATFVIPALGLFFAAWGCATRRAGLIIPGGILLGAGTGAALAAQSFTPAGGTDQGAIVVLCLALGFAVITPLTWAFTERMHWWPLIPGGVLAFVGISLLGGDWGMQALIWLGRLWPIVLIITGAVLLWHVARKR
jgi:hypothetical protein